GADGGSVVPHVGLGNDNLVAAAARRREFGLPVDSAGAGAGYVEPRGIAEHGPHGGRFERQRRDDADGRGHTRGVGRGHGTAAPPFVRCWGRPRGWGLGRSRERRLEVRLVREAPVIPRGAAAGVADPALLLLVVPPCPQLQLLPLDANELILV